MKIKKPAKLLGWVSEMVKSVRKAGVALFIDVVSQK